MTKVIYSNSQSFNEYTSPSLSLSLVIVSLSLSDNHSANQSVSEQLLSFSSFFLYNCWIQSDALFRQWKPTIWWIIDIRVYFSVIRQSASSWKISWQYQLIRVNAPNCLLFILRVLNWFHVRMWKQLSPGSIKFVCILLASVNQNTWSVWTVISYVTFTSDMLIIRIWRYNSLGKTIDFTSLPFVRQVYSVLCSPALSLLSQSYIRLASESHLNH